VFDNNGTFKTEIKNVGNAQAICITPGGNQVMYVSNSNPPTDLDTAGEIYKMRLDESVIGKFGRAGKLLKEFGTVNAIDCRSASPSNPVVLRDDLHPATALTQNCTSDGAPYSCGATGAITRLQAGVQERIATGLPSGIALQNPGAGNVKLGPNAVSWLGVGRP